MTAHDILNASLSDGLLKSMGQTAREILSNMPDEVFEIYIEPLIQSYGWPFESVDSSVVGTRWHPAFDHHSLKTISQLSWERHEISFSLTVFHPDSQGRIIGITQTHIHGINTPFASIINGKDRFFECCEYIARTARMPVPVILMRDARGLLSILDGNHRLAAMPNPSSVVDCWIGALVSDSRQRSS